MHNACTHNAIYAVNIRFSALTLLVRWQEQPVRIIPKDSLPEQLEEEHRERTS